MRRCEYCSTDNADSARFCTACGRGLTLSCSTCGAEVKAGARFCSSCGTAAGPMTPAALPTEPSDTLAEWERRHLTVLFCDVVNSTRMAAELDPEDWRDALAAFQQAATAAVEQQGGYVAQYSGDGIVVYFGYPHAFEDNVSRGVRAGLRIVETARTLTAGASASTLTVSATPPIARAASTRLVSLTFRTMPLRVAVLNPDRVTSTM